MNYDIQATSTLIGSISGDDVKIIFNPKLQKLYTGDGIKITDKNKQGIVLQVYNIENLNLFNIKDEAIKSQIDYLNNIAHDEIPDDTVSLNVASCKIKFSIIANKWLNWRGNLPSMSDYIEVIPSMEVISHTVGSSPLNPIYLGNLLSENPAEINFEASLLEKTTLIVGDKSKEKANLVSIISEELINKKAKVLLIDPKGSYHNLKNANLIEAGKHSKLSVIDYGINTLCSLLLAPIEANLKSKLEGIFLQICNHTLETSNTFISLSLFVDSINKEISRFEAQKAPTELNILKSRIISLQKLGIFAESEEDVVDINNIFFQ